MLTAPFPYFGGKREVAAVVWQRFGNVLQYLEPFAGSCAVLLAAPKPASLEVVNDLNHYVANFWRAVKCQPDAVAHAADYPVTHIDMAARHAWLTEPERVRALRDALLDAEWPGDARIAGWWVWGLCSWIGSGWCDKPIEHASGIEAPGKIAHASDSGRGLQAPGQKVFVSVAGQGLQANTTNAHRWIAALSARLARVRVQGGTWDRALNAHYGKENTGVFLDPPYRAFESLYADAEPVADAVEAWARDNAHLRIALCGHAGDYDLPGWDLYRWSRSGNTYASTKTRHEEAIYFSPACLAMRQGSLF